MAWKDSIKDATYTSPSGKEFTFHYSSGVTSELDLKTATFTFPEKDGALVVPLGYGGKRFPMTIQFYGENCIDDADSFEAGLKERGYGELQHPVYGIHKVVPTGTIKRSDDVVQQLNVSSVEVTFSETLIGQTFPDSKTLTQDEINSAMDSFTDAAAAEFANNMNPENVSQSISVQSTLKKIVSSIIDGIEDLCKQSNSVYASFQEIQSGLDNAISSVASEPIKLAQQLLYLSKAPSRLCITVTSKIEGYSTVINDLISNFKKDKYGINAAKNDFICARLAVQSLMASLSSGIALAMVSDGEIDSPAGESSAAVSDVESNPGRFKSREDAVDAVDSLLELYDDVIDFLDLKTDEDFIVETGEGFDYMRNVVSSSVQMILDQSFNLDTRKIIKLGQDRQIIELMYELYGNLDRMDEFIVDNQITYNELIVLPMGKEVAYYV